MPVRSEWSRIAISFHTEQRWRCAEKRAREWDSARTSLVFAAADKYRRGTEFDNILVESIAAAMPSLNPFGIALLSSLLGLASWRRLGA